MAQCSDHLSKICQGGGNPGSARRLQCVVLNGVLEDVTQHPRSVSLITCHISLSHTRTPDSHALMRRCRRHHQLPLRRQQQRGWRQQRRYIRRCRHRHRKQRNRQIQRMKRRRAGPGLTRRRVAAAASCCVPLNVYLYRAPRRSCSSVLLRVTCPSARMAALSSVLSYLPVVDGHGVDSAPGYSMRCPCSMCHALCSKLFQRCLRAWLCCRISGRSWGDATRA